ncbi:MAG: Glu-tRNA(Gln) amidotransferase subunit GatD [Nanoarchaeota archaeon]
MKEGERTEIKTKDGNKTGIILPSTEKDTIILKLDSGYNIGIDKKNIISSKTIDKESKTSKKWEKMLDEEKKTAHKEENNKNLKTILILHTGGTIASRVSYKTGAVAPNFSPEELLQIFPELKNLVNIKSKLAGIMFSEDMRFAHYNRLAKEIEKEINNVDGIIITHGTDTLAITSAALAFALENLNKPVILVGAQRSSDRPSSDAALNLICAAQFIAKTEYNEVAICMHGKSSDENCYILPATKTRKMHSSRRDAFKAINSKPIAEVTKTGNVKFLEHYNKKEHSEKLKLKLYNEKLKIGILRAHPNMFADEIKNYSKFDGLIIEGYGIAGNFPINVVDKETKEHDIILKELTKLSKKIPVVATTQCIFGNVNMNVYDTGRKQQEAGILGNLLDMTTETAFIKLAWLLSNYKDKETRELISKNLHGEINHRIEYQEEFI